MQREEEAHDEGMVLRNWATMSRRKCKSAKQWSETDQRTKEQECGGRSKHDGISG